MTAGSRRSVWIGSERIRILDRAVVDGDADIRRHVPHADRIARVGELLQQTAKHGRLHRVRTQFRRVLCPGGQAVPTPLGVAFDDFEDRVAEGFRALVAGGQAGARRRGTAQRRDGRGSSRGPPARAARARRLRSRGPSRGSTRWGASRRRPSTGRPAAARAGRRLRDGDGPCGVKPPDRAVARVPSDGTRSIPSPRTLAPARASGPCPARPTANARSVGCTSTPGCRCDRAR